MTCIESNKREIRENARFYWADARYLVVTSICGWTLTQQVRRDEQATIRRGVLIVGTGNVTRVFSSRLSEGSHHSLVKSELSVLLFRLGWPGRSIIGTEQSH